MSTVQQDVEGLEQALAEMGKRAAADPDYRDQLISEHMSALAAAGVSALSLTESLIEVDASQEDVVAFDGTPMSFGDLTGRGGTDPDSQPILISNACITTCGPFTFQICCTKSLRANPGPGTP